jgi:hypothetical protein
MLMAPLREEEREVDLNKAPQGIGEAGVGLNGTGVKRSWGSAM